MKPLIERMAEALQEVSDTTRRLIDKGDAYSCKPAAQRSRLN